MSSHFAPQNPEPSYRKYSFLQAGFFRQAFPSRRRIVAPSFKHESTPAVVHPSVTSVRRLGRRSWWSWPAVSAPQGSQRGPHLFRWLVMGRKTEGRTGPDAVTVSHTPEPLTLVSSWIREEANSEIRFLFFIFSSVPLLFLIFRLYSCNFGPSSIMYIVPGPVHGH